MSRQFSKQFYDSAQWERVRTGVLMRDRYMCTRCGRPAEEVHHIKHLTPENINDPNVSLNPNNLTSLCRDCHFEEHRNDRARGHTRDGREIDHREVEEGFMFDENGQLVRVKKAETPQEGGR